MTELAFLVPRQAEPAGSARSQRHGGAWGELCPSASGRNGIVGGNAIVSRGRIDLDSKFTEQCSAGEPG
jgi:hypothetical protein